MSISVEKQKPASERFMLARIEPRRIITLVDEGADEFSATFPYPISKIVIDGATELTRVSTISGFNQFTHNESTGALRLKYDDGGDAFHCVVYYYLFYTGTVGRAAHEDPENTATTLRSWDPKILAYPSTIESFNDILSGVFSLQDTKLELINHELEFSQYLTDNDSFSNAEILLWLCINSTENIQRVFTGRVTSVFLDHRSVVLQCANNFKLLENSATMGRPIEEFEVPSGSSTVVQSDVGKLVPFIMGKDSYFLSEKTLARVRKITGGNRAICTPYSSNKSKTTNRRWALCNATSDVSTNSLGSLLGTDSLIIGNDATWLVSSISNLQIGDTIKVQYNNGGVKTSYLRVGFAGAFTMFPSTSRNIAWDTRSKTPDNTLSVTVGNFIQFYTMPSIAVIIKNGDNIYYPYYERDYTLSVSDMLGAPATTKSISIIFNDNFEDNIRSDDNYNAVVDGIPTLDPDIHEVYFRLTLPQMTHGTALKELVNRAGIPDDGNFNAGFNATIDAPVQFQIPNIDETYLNTYRKYCEDILGGTLGYLRMNTDGEAEYIVSESPAPVSNNRDENLVLKQSLGVEVQYQDIATNIVMYNPHNQNSVEVAASTNSPALSAENLRAKYLHLTENLDRLKHPFKYVDGIIDRLMGVYSNRRAVYSFRTATEDIDTKLGDDVTVVSDMALGSGEIKVTEVEKTTSRTTIRGTDLLGIND